MTGSPTQRTSTFLILIQNNGLFSHVIADDFTIGQLFGGNFDINDKS